MQKQLAKTIKKHFLILIVGLIIGGGSGHLIYNKFIIENLYVLPTINNFNEEKSIKTFIDSLSKNYKIKYINLRIKIYPQYRKETDIKLVDRIIKSLKDSGYEVSEKEVTSENISGDVRYFYKENSDEANKILKIIERTYQVNNQQSPLKLNFREDLNKDVRPGVIELWIP